MAVTEPTEPGVLLAQYCTWCGAQLHFRVQILFRTSDQGQRMSRVPRAGKARKACHPVVGGVRAFLFGWKPQTSVVHVTAAASRYTVSRVCRRTGKGSAKTGSSPRSRVTHIGGEGSRAMDMCAAPQLSHTRSTLARDHAMTISHRCNSDTHRYHERRSLNRLTTRTEVFGVRSCFACCQPAEFWRVDWSQEAVARVSHAR